jgi:hypothetical protein
VVWRTRMKRRPWLIASLGILAIVVLAVVLRPRSCESKPSPPDATVTEVAPPADLLAEIVLPSPNATWSKLQRGIGGAVGILPMTVPGLLVTLADLDPALGAELDGTSPLYAIVAGTKIAIAMRLVDARRARSLLGDAGPKKDFAFVLTEDGWAVVARTRSEIDALAPYLTKTLPARPVPAGAIVIDVVGPALASVLGDAWNRGKAYLEAQDARMRAERGRAPDFGDPAAILRALDGIVRARLAVLGDVKRAHLVVDVDADGIIANGTIAKPTGEALAWAKAMSVGDASELRALPASAALAIAMRDDEASIRAQGESLRSFVTTAFRPKDPAVLDRAVTLATKARGETSAVAVLLDEPQGAFLESAVRDKDAADGALRAIAELAASFKELLRVREPTITTQEQAELGPVSVASFARTSKGRDAGAAAPPLAAAWSIKEGTARIGLGLEPVVTMRLAAREKKLGDEPSLSKFLAAIGADASTIVVAQPLRVDPKRAALPTAPLAIAVGRRGDDVFLRAEAGFPVLREVARWQVGF